MPQDIKQISIIPDLPRDKKVISDNGEMNTSWYLFFDQLTVALQSVLKPEGFVMPKQTTDNIALLVNQDSVANIIFDSTVGVFKGRVSTDPDTYNWKTFDMS